MPPRPSYDLMVLLDPEAAEDARAAVLERIKGQLESGDATLKGDADWGMRRLAYEIDHRTEAQYHLFQFEAAAAVLNELDRTLSIDDVVLRFRTIRLPGDTPEVTPPAPPHVAPEPRGRRDDRGRRDGSDRGRDFNRSAPSQTEETPAPEADTELARAEEDATSGAPAEEDATSGAPAEETATSGAPAEPAGDAGSEPPAA
jgi:small subunit ribosomal protein S6